MNRKQDSERLPKNEILRKTKEFQTLFHQGRQWNGRLLKVVFQPGQYRRVAFVVPKRLGKAVLRNRMKRLMREAYRKHRSEMEKLEMILIARQAAWLISFAEIEHEVHSFIQSQGRNPC